MATPPPDGPLIWTDDGQPRSRLYGDIYFSTEDGLAESRAVFLDGCGLPAAWAGRSRFVVGELGFGAGLNIAALLDLWRRTRAPDAQLHVFTVEAHPLSADEARRALAPWPEIAPIADLLIARWPGRARGFHRVGLPEFGASIDVAVMDVAEALGAWDGRADAWFLDGFSPALNPQMWRDEVLQGLADRSVPGARAATFTVAGQVRRGLTAAGFTLEKKPGYGRKRERLEARLAGNPSSNRNTPRVAIIGAGIAGASAARALRRLGVDAQVFEAERPGAGASGNPAALVTARLDAGLGPPAQLFAQALAHATRLYDALPEAVIARSVLQLAQADRDPHRFRKIAASDLFESDALAMLSPDEAAAVLGEAAPESLVMREALVVDPAVVLRAWLGDPRIATVAKLAPQARAWRLLDAADRQLMEADAVILAAGLDSRRLWPVPPLSPVRGQVSWARTTAPLAFAAAWGGYAAPTRDGVIFGATHDRDDEGLDLREADHRRNLATLAQALPHLADGLEGTTLEGRAAIRTVTRDRLPLAGALPGVEGLHVLGGFGARGFALAPLLAEHVAARIIGAPSPLPLPLAALVAPERFALRDAKRGRS